jgi:hypothetical protein
MKTKHFQKRMSQRAIRDDVVAVVLEFGTPLHNGRRRLDNKTIKRELDALDRRRRALLDAQRKGGVVVVVGEEDMLVTTYRVGRS